MDPRKLTELLRATIDPAQQKQAEEQLNQVRKFNSEKRAPTCDTSRPGFVFRNMWWLRLSSSTPSTSLHIVLSWQSSAREKGHLDLLAMVITLESIEFFTKPISCALLTVDGYSRDATNSHCTKKKKCDRL